MILTPLEQAVYDVLKSDGVDYVGAEQLRIMSWNKECPTCWELGCVQGQVNRFESSKYAAGDNTERKRIQRALQSLVKKGLVDHPARGKYAADPRTAADFMATLKPWDCVKVQVEPGDSEWLICIDEHITPPSRGLLSVKDGFYMYDDGTKSSFRKMPGRIHLHEIDTQDVRNVKPGGVR